MVRVTPLIDFLYVLTFNESGAPFEAEKLKVDELESGTWKSSWLPKFEHPSIPPEQVDMFSRFGTAGILLAMSDNAFECSDEWNRLLPDYKFTQPEEFLADFWRGKP